MCVFGFNENFMTSAACGYIRACLDTYGYARACNAFYYKSQSAL